MMCGRKFLMLLLVCFFSLPVHSQESNPIESIPSQNEIQAFPNLWLDIDLTLNLLEKQTIDMQTLTDKQKTQIQNLENAYQSTYLLYLNSENRSQELEQSLTECNQSLKVWKTVAISTSVTTVILIVGVIVKCTLK